MGRILRRIMYQNIRKSILLFSFSTTVPRSQTHTMPCSKDGNTTQTQTQIPFVYVSRSASLYTAAQAVVQHQQPTRKHFSHRKKRTTSHQCENTHIYAPFVAARRQALPTMVMAFSTRSPNPGKKRSLLVKGSWTLSWRSSKKNLESESSTEDAQQDNPQSSPSSVPRRAVQFDEAKLVTEIPEEENPITPSELDMIWYKVRP